MTDQKGLPLIEQVMGRFVERDIQLVVVGTGETGYENMFKYYASQYPGLISSNILFSNELAHKIYAAADAFLMPSQFEPCGLSQLIAMRYGAVPIVRETGGLKETVIPFNEYSGEGTGFSFKNYDAEEMWNAIQYAREIYNDRTVWNSIARRVWHRTSLGRNLLRNMLIYTQSYLSEASDNMIYTEEEPWKQAGFLLMRTT